MTSPAEQDFFNSKKAGTLVLFAILFCLAALDNALTTAQAALTVKAASPRAGFLFTDSEPVDMLAAVAGALGAATVTWSVQETEGPWKNSGELTIPVTSGQGEKPLALGLPGRGLYQLTLNASAGGETTSFQTTVAIVFTPSAPDPASPWSIFFIPNAGLTPDDPNGAKAIALSHRLLGAAWSRFNFWANAYGTITITQVDGKPVLTVDPALWKEYAQALHAEGISLMGGIAHCPGPLSSKEGDTSTWADGGELQWRVKPRSYEEWDQLMEQLGAQFKDEINVWEIWNEVNYIGGYWAGTQEELAELIHHSSVALRKGNPAARIAGCGFTTEGVGYADKMFELGMGNDIDILTVHYTDDSPQTIDAWTSLLKKYNLTIPIWNTEEQPEVPLTNLSSPIERSFKFLHIGFSSGYDSYGPLVNLDYTVRPPGIWFSVGAHCIGTGKFASKSSQVPGYETFFFQRGEEKIAVLRGKPFTNIFGQAVLPKVMFAAEPLAAGQPVTITDRYGRSRTLEIKDGQTSATIDANLLFINGAHTLEILKTEVDQSSLTYLIFEAESGRISSGGEVSTKEGFSGGKIAEMWATTEPDEAGYTVEVDMDVPEDGTYEVIFSGSSLTREAPPRSLSPFEWSIDGGLKQQVDKAIPMIPNTATIGEGLSRLGVASLRKGTHTFQLKLTGRRDTPENYYALWFDAVILRKIADRSAAGPDCLLLE